MPGSAARSEAAEVQELEDSAELKPGSRVYVLSAT